MINILKNNTKKRLGEDPMVTEIPHKNNLMLKSANIEILLNYDPEEHALVAKTIHPAHTKCRHTSNKTIHT